MKILLVYATYSGGTEVVSGMVDQLLRDNGKDVTQKHIKETKPEEIEHYDIILFGSPSWMVNKQDGQPHEFYFPFMQAFEGKTFKEKKFAVFGLGDTAYTRFTHGVDVLEEFILKTLQGSLLLSSLRIDGFFFEQRKNEEKVREWTKELVSRI